MLAHSAIPANAVQYRPIEGFPGYRVGDDGSVWTRRVHGHNLMSDVWREMSLTPQHSGHLTVKLTRNKKGSVRLVHRLVLEAFVGPCPEGMEACHDPDPSPSNNRPENLRWDTRKANHADAVRHGTKGFGEASGRAKLTDRIVEQIMILRDKGVRSRMICKELGLDVSLTSTVEHVIKGHNWNHVTGLPRPEPKASKRG